MLNFNLYNPTRLVFGAGQIAQLKSLIPTDQKILLVYGGGSIFKNGIHKQVTEALDQHQVIEFGGIEANPHFETLMKAVSIIRTEKIDFILAVGGGSVIDGVKFISAAAPFEGEPIDIIKKKAGLNGKALPFGTVLTLPATGSEMNSGAVITIESTQEKLSFGDELLFPKFSICDPNVIASLPQKQIVNGVTDSFIHVLEQYLTYPQEAPLQDRFAEGILQTLIEIGPKVIANPKDYDAAANLMWCCTMALNGLISMGVKTDWVTHAIGHELTALYGIDHGRTLAIIGPNLYRVMFDTKKDKLTQFGKRVWKITEGTDEEIAQKAIEAMVDFYHQLGIKTKLSENTHEIIDRTPDFITKRFEERGWIAMGEKQNITLDKIKEIVSLSL